MVCMTNVQLCSVQLKQRNLLRWWRGMNTDRNTHEHVILLYTSCMYIHVLQCTYNTLFSIVLGPPVFADNFS